MFSPIYFPQEYFGSEYFTRPGIDEVGEGALTELKYTTEIVHDVLVRAGEGTDSTTDSEYELYDSVITWINRAYRLICDARTDWPWLRKQLPGTLVLQPAISSGTVSTTAGSTAVTFSTIPQTSLAVNTSVQYWFLRVDNDADYYRVAAHTSGATSATLDTAYTGNTKSAAGYTLIKLEYELASDVIRVIDPLIMTGLGVNARAYGELVCIQPADMSREFPVMYVNSGTPEFYAYVGETRIRINRYPESLLAGSRVEYNYHYRPTDLTGAALEEPDMPLDRRFLLGDYALCMLLDTISDDRADKWLQLANLNINNFIEEYNYRKMRQNPNMLTVRPRRRYGRVHGVWANSGLFYGR